MVLFVMVTRRAKSKPFDIKRNERISGGGSYLTLAFGIITRDMGSHYLFSPQ